MKTTEDIKIIELLFERDQEALAHVEAKYKNLYKSILTRILSDSEDISECENDVLLAVWDSIPPNRPNNLSAYISKIARNISINKFKYNNRSKRSDGYTAALDELYECIPDKSPQNSIDVMEEQSRIKKILSEFFEKLDKESRVLFIRRYFYLETVTELSKRYNITENKISVKLFRARKKLHKILGKEDIEL